MNKTTTKVILKDLLPNPFKKEIDGGELNEEQIGRLVEGYRQTTFHENILARKNKNGRYELVYGHHRLEAAKRVYGKDHEIRITVVDYDDEQMLMDLCRENLTQRHGEFRQELGSVLAVKKHLEKSGVQQVDTSERRDDLYQGIGARQVAEFLSAEGKTISKSKVADLLRIKQTLSTDILDKVNKFSTGSKVDSVTYKQALSLAGIESKQEQKAVLKALQEADITGRPQELIQEYKKAPDKVKEQVLAGKIPITEVKLASDNEEFMEKLKQASKAEYDVQIETAREKILELKDEMNKIHREFDKFFFKAKEVRRNGFKWFDDKNRESFQKFITLSLNTIESYREKFLDLEEELLEVIGK